MQSSHTAKQQDQFRRLIQARLRELAQLSTSLSRKLEKGGVDDRVGAAAQAILDQASIMSSSVREFTQGNETVVPPSDMTNGEGSVLLIKQEDESDTAGMLPEDSGIPSSGLGDMEQDAAYGSATSDTQYVTPPVYPAARTACTSLGLTQYSITADGLYPVIASVPISLSAPIPPTGQSLHSRGPLPFEASFSAEQQSEHGVRYILTTTLAGTAYVTAQVTAVPLPQV